MRRFVWTESAVCASLHRHGVRTLQTASVSGGILIAFFIAMYWDFMQIASLFRYGLVLALLRGHVPKLFLFRHAP
jgi:hypothetical protein